VRDDQVVVEARSKRADNVKATPGSPVSTTQCSAADAEETINKAGHQ